MFPTNKYKALNMYRFSKFSFLRSLDDLQFKYGVENSLNLEENSVNSNVLFINNPDPNPDPNPDLKLMLKPDPNPDPKKK